MAPHTKKMLTEVCRWCLEGIRGCSEFYPLDFVYAGEQRTLRDKLAILGYEVDLRITPNAVICLKCLSQEKDDFTFQTKFAESSTQIMTYWKTTASGSSGIVDLRRLYRHLLQQRIRASNLQAMEALGPPVLEPNCGESLSFEKQASGDVSFDLVEILDDSDPPHLDRAVDEDEENGTEEVYCCDSCSYRTALKENLEAHVQEHQVGPSRATVHRGEKVIKFDICTCRARKKANKRYREMQINAFGKRAKKRFRCKNCNYSTLQGARLLVHSIAVHEVSISFKYKCQACSYNSSLRL